MPTPIVVRRANEIYLRSLLSELGPQALAEAVRLESAEPAKCKVCVRTVRRPGLHPVGIVQITSGAGSAYVFAKVQKSEYRGSQTLERELSFLSDVAPLITAKNPRLRAPNPIAYYPDRGLLLMEFIPGQSLKHHLFDVSFDAKSGRGINLAQLLQSSGQWLGHLHSLTALNETGNPLEWLLQEFTSVKTVDVFLRYSQKESYNELLSILRQCIDRNPEFSRNLCMVHGEFTPIHVMVAGEAIYVVDFGYSKLGYPYEDVGSFTGFYDCLLPWRTGLGGMRVQLDNQKRLFLKGYFEQAPFRFGLADAAIMRWVRLIWSARMLHGAARRSDGLGKWACSSVGKHLLRSTFVAHCREELTSLRQIREDVFIEEPQTMQVHPAISASYE